MSVKAKVTPILIPAFSGHFLVGTIMMLTRGEILVGLLMFVFSIGLVCNWLVLATNGWKMPVSRATDPDDELHVRMGPHHRFTILADIIPVGHIRASIGDVLMIFRCGPLIGLLLRQA